MGSKALKITSVGDFEITVTENSAMSHVTLMKITDIFTGYKKTQLGLSKKDVTQLIRNLMEVSGVSQEDLAEPTFKYILPLKLSVVFPTHANLVKNRNNDATFVSEGLVEDDLNFQTRFTEAEFNAIVEEFPEFSVLYKEVL